ncbi:MAG: hypothetical protein CMJ32_01065 [Phycisphaerae bacterium]|nr:hypothetical protein [Phycisphaerae bacterium]
MNPLAKTTSILFLTASMAVPFTHATSSLMAQDAADSTANSWLEVNEGAFEFPGGTLKEFAVAVKKQIGSHIPVSMTMSPGVDQYRIPAISVQMITLDHLMDMAQALAYKLVDGAEQKAIVSIETADGYNFVVSRKIYDTPDRAVFYATTPMSLAPFISDGMGEDDLLGLIQSTLAPFNVSEEDMITMSYHENTQILLVKYPEFRATQVEQTLASLMDQLDTSLHQSAGDAPSSFLMDSLDDRFQEIYDELARIEARLNWISAETKNEKMMNEDVVEGIIAELPDLPSTSDIDSITDIKHVQQMLYDLSASTVMLEKIDDPKLMPLKIKVARVYGRLLQRQRELQKYNPRSGAGADRSGQEE